MIETWLCLHSNLCPPAENMAWDEAMLEAAGRLGQPVLRFYGWTEAAATFGYFQSYANVAAWTKLRPLIRRPTGGGLVPHDCDWTYSLVFPPGHPWFQLKAVTSYERVHEWIRLAFQSVGLETSLAPCCQKEQIGRCFVGAERSDVLWKGRKLAGAAQRRNRLGLLIQGSIQPQSTHVERSAWEQAMFATASSMSQMHWRELVPDRALRNRVETLALEKYGRDEFNQQR